VNRIALAALGLLLVVLLLRPRHEQTPLETRRFALGTLVTVKLFTGRANGPALADTAFAVMGRIESAMSRHIDSSEANRIERTAVGRDVRCSPEMAEVLACCQGYAELTRGRFDITVGALTRLWDFPDALAPPMAARIDSAMAHVGYQALHLSGDLVRLDRTGVRLDLGAAAKGYAVDRAVARLCELGAEAGLIEAGGDIRYWGQKPDGTPWRFGIQHPRDAQSYARADDIGLASIATSGDYEQFFLHQGRRYHHILDPETGYPADLAISATVWAPSALEADVLSTAVFILGPEQGLALAERLPQVEALVYYQEGDGLRHRGSSGINGHLRFSDGEN
jgi:FAD:protein FMN transferase